MFAFGIRLWGYPLENRSYNFLSVRYNFTGKERDAETSYDYFGARYYDSRIGRWGQVELLLSKYLNITPYSYSINNPIINIDPNGKDPYRKYLASLSDVQNILIENQDKSYLEIGLIFRTSGTRYLATEKGGFIDLNHFFVSAWVSSMSEKLGLNSKNTTLMAGEVYEFIQGTGLLTKESYNDPEDRPSNYLGVQYGKDAISGENKSETFTKFIEGYKPLDPKSAEITPSKVYIPYDENSLPLPSRISYDPYFGEDPSYPDAVKRGDADYK